MERKRLSFMNCIFIKQENNKDKSNQSATANIYIYTELLVNTITKYAMKTRITIRIALALTSSCYSWNIVDVAEKCC